MLELKEPKNSLTEGYAAAGSNGGPEELAAMRTESFRRFSEAGIPTTKHEEWKYTSLRSLAETRFQLAKHEPVGIVDLRSSAVGSVKGPRLAFVNGFFDASLSDLADLPTGLSVRPLSEALREEPGAVLESLGKIATLSGRLGSFNDERFAWLNTSHFADGAFVRIEPGAEIDPTIHLVFLASVHEVSAAFYPRVLVVAEPGAKARILESHLGARGAYFSCPVTEIGLAAEARVEHVRLQLESEEAHSIGTLAIRQEARSEYRSTVASFGGRLARLDVHAWVGGERAETSLDGVYVATGEQHMDHHTRIDHAVPNCHSFEVYKGILDGRAKGVFNGKIFVYQDAQKTDAKQTNQALLLSNTATIDTKPQLEIFADDVKCTHGATVGRLREDALFYLRSRGIPEADARNLLIFAFAAEVLEPITDDEVRRALERQLFAKLGGSGVIPI